MTFSFVKVRAGRSPTFQDPGTPLHGLAGTRPDGSAVGSSVVKLWGVPGESFDVDSYPRVSLGLAGTRVPGYPLTALVKVIF